MDIQLIGILGVQMMIFSLIMVIGVMLLAISHIIPIIPAYGMTVIAYLLLFFGIVLALTGERHQLHKI